MTPDLPEPQPSRSLLAGAVETHAAIREGTPHVPVDGGVTDKASQPPSVTHPRSRRAPRRRKVEE